MEKADKRKIVLIGTGMVGRSAVGWKTEDTEWC